MPEDNNESLSQQRRILNEINNTYNKINEKLLVQLAAQESIAAGGAADAAALESRLSELRRGFGMTGASASAAATEVDGLGSSASDAATAIVTAGEEGAESLTGIKEVMGGLINAAGQLASAWDNTAKTIHTNAEGTLRPALVAIQEAYGGVTLAAMNASAETGGAINVQFDEAAKTGNYLAGAMKRVAVEVNTATYGFRTFGEAGQSATLPLQWALGTTMEQMEVFNTMAIEQGLINSMAMAELAMSEAGAESIIQMRAVQKGLGLTADETSTFVQRQISLTGKAGTDMLTEAAMSAKAVAKIVGSSAKLIGKSIQEIIADTENFGNVTVDEAARISGALSQIGIDYKDLGGMIAKFSNFESAVDAISQLTVVTGVQLDAMEMMRLANTDQEGFLRYIRDQFITTGMSIKDMDLPTKRLIEQVTGLGDIESIERLLDPGRSLSSIEELSAATAEMAPEDAAERTQVIMEQLGDEMLSMADLTKYTTEEMATFFQEGMIAPLHEARIAAEQTMAAVTGKGMAAGAPAMQDAQAAAETMQSMFADTIGPAKASIKVLTDSLLEGFTEVIELLKGPPALINQSDSVWDITFRDKAPESIGKTTSALLEMTDEMKSSFEGITEGPLDGFLTALGDGIPESMAIASGEMAKFADMSKKDLKELMSETDGMGQKLAQQLGFLQQRGGELTTEALEELARDIGFSGDDWKERMDIIMSTQADEAGASQALKGDAVTAMLEAYQEMGTTMEDMGGAEGEWAKAYAAEYSLSPEELQAALVGGADVGTIVRSSLDEANVKAAEARAEEQSRTERLREEYEARDGGGAAGTSEQRANVSANTRAIDSLTKAVGLLKDSMSDRPIVIQLGGKTITDYIVETPGGRTSTAGNTLALEPAQN